MLMAIANDPQTPPATATTAKATVWLLDVEIFRRQEEEFMISGEYEAKLGDHRFALSQLIFAGETIVADAKRTGLIATDEKFDDKFALPDLEATLDSLHTTFDCDHRQGNTSKMNDHITGLFNVPKS